MAAATLTAGTGIPRSETHLKVAFAAMALAFALAPLAVHPVFLMNVPCFALFACAFNLLIGYVGLLSFGHATFFGPAGYVAGHAAKVWGLPFELAVLAGTAAAAVLGFAVGALAIRRQGICFAMITLALAQMVYFFCLQAPFTGGGDGIQAIPRGRLFGLLDLSHTMTLYRVVLAVFLAGFLLIHRTIRSPFGQVPKAIRENEPRAVPPGYDTDRCKLAAFVLSATLAGGTKAFVLQLASLTDVHLAAEPPRPARRLGDGGAGRDLRPVRPRLPPRHRRRARQVPAAAPLGKKPCAGAAGGAARSGKKE